MSTGEAVHGTTFCSVEKLPALNFPFRRIPDNSHDEHVVTWADDDDKPNYDVSLGNWTFYAAFLRDPCDNYVHCGDNDNCVLNLSPICQYLERFIPASLENWNLKDFSKGCVRRKPLSYMNDGFAKYLRLSWILHTVG
ncbi:hypothetical protein DVH24_004314 [Malus domestica]|uniref:S-locus glycoprotein domain-containing protein n=1 Tax=Malus domestica TaxID=3750 RepID=A0A498KDT1_MALDO|nr:hypothetical protein DVH24_004314 [Malus domestica]